jgi:hypothetical protein
MPANFATEIAYLNYCTELLNRYSEALKPDATEARTGAATLLDLGRAVRAIAPPATFLDHHRLLRDAAAEYDVGAQQVIAGLDAFEASMALATEHFEAAGRLTRETSDLAQSIAADLMAGET